MNFHHVSLWVSYEGVCHQLREVCCKRNWCLNVKVWGGGWHVEWWWRSGRTDSHRGPNVPCALCPMYTVSSITSIYTPRHWKLSTLGWYIDSTGHFLCLLLLIHEHVRWNSTEETTQAVTDRMRLLRERFSYLVNVFLLVCSCEGITDCSCVWKRENGGSIKVWNTLNHNVEW